MVNKTVSVGTKKAAKVLNVAITTMQRWVDTGLIRAYKTAGGHRRIMMRDLAEFARQRGMPWPIAKTKPPSILIVDDEENVRQILSDNLSAKFPTFDIVTAANGFSAGVIVTQQKPDLILLDILLPGIDGIKVCQAIREDLGLAETIIIGITASRDKELLQAFRDAGANDIFFKPFNFIEVINVCQRLEQNIAPDYSMQKHSVVIGQSGY